MEALARARNELSAKGVTTVQDRSRQRCSTGVDAERAPGRHGPRPVSALMNRRWQPGTLHRWETVHAFRSGPPTPPDEDAGASRSLLPAGRRLW